MKLNKYSKITAVNKKTIITIIIAMTFCCGLFAQNFYNGYTGVLPTISNPNNITSAPFWVNQTRSDTTVITGSSLGGSYFGQVNGVDSLHPCVVYYNNVSAGGIKIENCKYFKAYAVGSTRTQSGGGVPLVITGHADFIQASGFVVLNGSAGAIWCKTEAADACLYPIPKDWLYPNHMRNIWITDCRVGNRDGTGFSSGDAFYLGSTGSKGDRPVPCLGNALIKPMYMSGVHALRDTVYGCRRSAIQISGADSGVNEIKNCYIYNVGSEYCALISNPPYNPQDSIAALSQGAGIRTGYGDGNNVEIAYNYVNKTFLYNLDIETGTNVHDNVVDSSGFYGTCKNPQQIQNVQCYAQQPNSVLILKNNISGGHSTQPQSISFNVSGSNNFSTTGNIICGNTGKVQVVQPFTYTTDCGVIPPPPDSIIITETIIHDTLVLGHFDSTFRDSAAQIFVPDHSRFLKIKNRRYRLIQTGEFKDTTYIVLVRPAFDSAYIAINGTPPHDTSYKVPATKTTGYGSFLTPTDSTTTLASRIHLNKNYGCTFMRDNWTFGTAYQVQQYKDSNLLVYCMINSPTTDSPHIPTDQNALADTVNARLNQSSPYILGYLNEASGGYSGTPQDYIAGLATIAPICHAHNVKVSNGGFTQDLCYPMKQYYVSRGYTDSITWLENIVGTLNLNSAFAQRKLAFYNVVLPYIRSSQLDYVDIHAYTPVTADTTDKTLSAFWSVATGFVISQTGKPVFFGEAGFRTYDATLSYNSLTQLNQTQPDVIIGYPNNGTLAVANEEVWANFVMNNP